MKIVQLVDTLGFGGLERLTVDMALQQKASGHEPRIYCLYKSGPMANDALKAGIPVVEFGTKSGVSVPVMLRMARLLRRDAPDVLHTHNAVVHHYGVIAARLAGVPVVVNTRHGVAADAFQIRRDGNAHSIANRMDPPSAPSRKRRQDITFKAMIPWTDALVMVSDDTREYFLRHRGFPPEKTFVIPNGVPVERFAALRPQPKSTWPRVRFGTVGRMIPTKDHATLIEAFRIVAADHPHAELVLAGDGPTLPQLEERIMQLGLGDRIKLLGAITDIPRVLSELDIFVLSSLSEGLPVVVLEAMAAGLPIVSTNVGGISEVVRENREGWLCPPGDPERLAAAMFAAVRRPDLRSIGKQAQRTARDGFDLSRMAERYAILFKDLLARKEFRAV